MYLNDFYVLHSEAIMLCQFIEEDLKWIYCYGSPVQDILSNYENVKKMPLGKLVNAIEELLHGRKPKKEKILPYSNFLLTLADKRNYWCHNIFVDFCKNDSFDGEDCLKGDFVIEKFQELKNDVDILRKTHDQTFVLRNELAVIRAVNAK